MPLPLNDNVSVVYQLPAVATPRQSFNLGLIVGNSTVISGATRVVVYSSLSEILGAGFTTSSPEYLAAQLYFAASSSPSKVAIGRQTTGESGLQAVQACRAANTDWYGVYVISAGDTDHSAIAAYVEGLSAPTTTYWMQSNAAGVLNNTTGNIFASLSAAKYKRTIGLYSTNTHAIAGVLGYAMGQTSDLASSAYTLKFKRLPGVTAENLTTQQALNISTNNGNFYTTRGTSYVGLENGNVFSGDWFDEIIYGDKLVNAIQLNIADLLYSVTKVAQTEGGVAQLKTVIADACQDFVNIGFIAPGQWNGGSILTLNTGDYLSSGYLILSQSIDSQSQADRDARKAPKIYVAVKLAGAIQSIVIEIDVNR